MTLDKLIHKKLHYVEKVINALGYEYDKKKVFIILDSISRNNYQITGEQIFYQNNDVFRNDDEFAAYMVVMRELELIDSVVRN